MKRKSKQKTLHQIWTKKCDTLFSLFIRLRSKRQDGPWCPFCKTRPIECCFHFIRRGKKSIRWDPDNAIGSCNFDNYRERFWPQEYTAYYIKRWGLANWESLVHRGNIAVDVDIPFLKETADRIRKWTEELPIIQPERSTEGQLGA